jgi:hypothetical protein
VNTPGSIERRDRYSWRWRVRCGGKLVTVASGACEGNAVPARDAQFPSGRVVYFIALDNLVKVGWSDNVSGRQRTLELATGRKMQLLCSVPGGLELERFLHDCFREYREQGEWFRNEGPVARALDALIRLDQEAAA